MAEHYVELSDRAGTKRQFMRSRIITVDPDHTDDPWGGDT